MARRTQNATTEATELGGALGFLQLLWAIDSGIQSVSKRMAPRLGVTGPQRLALRVLAARESMTAGDLADALRVHPSTLTGILARLDERGLIERGVDPFDGRRQLLRVTRKAGALLTRREGTVEAVVERLIEAVPPRQLEAARAVLGVLVDELQSAARPPPRRRPAKRRAR